MKKIFIFTIILILFYINFTSYASQKLEGISNFPESYKPYLIELQKRYPNWKFIALYTNLDWTNAINSENVYGKNLVPISYSDNWKNTNSGQYNIEIDLGWVDSSRKAVEYLMDPRNFLNEVRIFQFEELAYNQSTNSTSSIEKILYGTEFYNTAVNYLTSTGNLINTDKKYSDLILNAGITSGVSSYHLASRIKQEVGPFLSHHSISGIVEGYKGLYNFYNIGATDSTQVLGNIKNGLKYALNGNNANESTKNKYIIPWNTKERAITGGAIFIGSSYINVGQNTIYLQKFDVNDEKGGSLFWHQYMTNVLAPYSEGKSVYKGYVNTGLLNGDMSFIIPVYNNMPDINIESPDILEKDYENDNTKMYANVTNTLNVRSGPGASYEIVKAINKGDTMIRITKGIQSGDLWDRVILDDGIVGYVFQAYLKEVKENIPENPSNEIIEEPPETDEIIEEELPIIIDQSNLDKIAFNETLKLNGNTITGIDLNNNIVNDLLSKITTEFKMEVYGPKGDVLKETDKISTGTKIIFKNEELIIGECEILIYGDVNGDGKINSIDLLVLQRHILEIEKLKSTFLKAGNTSKNGKIPTSLDLLVIQRHILGLKELVQ